MKPRIANLIPLACLLLGLSLMWLGIRLGQMEAEQPRIHPTLVPLFTLVLGFAFIILPLHRFWWWVKLSIRKKLVKEAP